MYVIKRKTWDIINQLAEEECSHIPNHKNRIKANAIDKKLIELLEIVKVKTNDTLSIDNDVIIRHKENFGTKDYPYIRDICFEITIYKITDKTVSDNRYRYSKDSIVAILE